MTTKKKVAILIVVIFAVLALCALAGYTYQYSRAIAVQDDIKTARRSADSSLNQTIAQQASFLGQLGVTQHLASSKVDVCYVTHHDQGWIAKEWYQDCYIRSVEGYNTQLSKDQAKQKLSATTLFGQPKPEPANVRAESCTLFEQDHRDSVIYKSAQVISTDYSCEVPNQLQGLWSVRGPLMLDDELSVKRYKGFDQSGIDSAQAQLWVTQDRLYYHENLGCGVGIIFCENPRPSPAHPDL